MKKPLKLAVANLEIYKSRFYGFLCPIPLFSSKLEELRREHPKANHFVTALRYFEGGRLRERGNDDGEPPGTGGRPILQILEGEGIVEVGVIVVRYFGGILLGRGGLARAYGEVVKRAIKGGEFTPFYFPVEIEVELPFNQIGRGERIISQHLGSELELTKREYTLLGVKFYLRGERGKVTHLLQLLSPLQKRG
jgi:putative IMPACT (imprinted ancient) family translation regulator